MTVPEGAIVENGYWWDGTAWQLITQETNGHVEFATHERMSILIFGASKVGKSTLAATAPPPILVLDAEGSWRFIGDPQRVVTWNIVSEAMPTYDGSWDICVVHVRDWQTMERAYSYLRQYSTPFVTVVLDSITEIQRRLKANIRGAESMKMQYWGDLLDKMDDLIRGIRDLTLIPSIPLRCVVFTAESIVGKDNKLGPSMQGQISGALPYWVDLSGYFFSGFDVDANGIPTQEVRKLWIGPHAGYHTGSRVQLRLGYELIARPPDPTGALGTDIQEWMTRAFRSREGSST